jgi:hypothetical protein
MNGVDVSQLVANAFLWYTNLDFNIADYQHPTIFFGCFTKQGHCTHDLPIDETFEHTTTIVE